MYRLEAENFLLEFDPMVYETDLSFPLNMSLHLKVVSYGFSVDSMMDIDVYGLAGFAASLNRLYETLGGYARLEEPYGDSYLEFTVCGRGHIHVKGSIYHHVNDCEHELTFENEFDQTYLKCFAKSLFDDYKKYVRISYLYDE